MAAEIFVVGAERCELTEIAELLIYESVHSRGSGARGPKTRSVEITIEATRCLTRAGFDPGMWTLFNKNLS